MTLKYKKYISTTSIFVLSLFLAFFSFSAKGETLDTTKQEPAEAQVEKFKPGETIIEHIVDSYGWHIATYKDHHIAIPLPVILWDNGHLVCFSSNKFHAGTAAYQGYMIAQEGNQKGSIVKLKTDYTGHLEKGEVYEINEEAQILDFSITKNVCALFISIILIVWIFLSVAKVYQRREGKAPKGFQAMMEVVILFIRDEVAKPSLGDKYKKYLPYLLTLFFFILINNLMGLLPIFPGGANLTGNIAITGILALLTFLITSFSANKSYWIHIVNTPGVPWWLKFPLPIMPIVEFIGIFTKPFVLMVRLFANITAGHIIILGFISLIFIFGEMTPALGFAISPVSLFFYLFMGLLELIVAFIQAFVFTLLTAMFVGMAMEDSHEHAESSEEVENVKSLGK